MIKIVALLLCIVASHTLLFGAMSPVFASSDHLHHNQIQTTHSLPASHPANILLDSPGVYSIAKQPPSPAVCHQPGQCDGHTSGAERHVDQAEHDRLFKQIEARLLEIFGLSNRPRPSRQISIPTHMIELYLLQQSVHNPSDDQYEQSSDFTTADHLAYEHLGSTTHFSIDSKGNRQKHARTRCSSSTSNLAENGSRIPMLGWANTIRSHPFARSVAQSAQQVLLQFNVSLPSDERLVAAELRLFVNGCTTFMPQSSSVSSSSSSSASSSCECADQWFRISVDDVIPFDRQSTFLQANHFGLRQIDVQTVRIQSDQWLQFDVLPAIQRWFQSSPTSGTMLIRTQSIGASVSNHVAQLMLSPTSDDSFWQMYKPILLTYR